MSLNMTDKKSQANKIYDKKMYVSSNEGFQGRYPKLMSKFRK